MMTIFELTAVILTLTAGGSYVNHRYMHLPASIGAMLFALLASLAAIGLSEMEWINLSAVSDAVGQIDFSAVLLHGMLSFLLFAGALHIRFDDLRSVGIVVGVLATAGVVMATAIIGTLVWLVAQWLGIDMPYIYALLFGALISPTDPIAVLAMLKQANVSQKLYVKIGGESLFNDGIGVVLFLVLLTLATSDRPMGASEVAVLLAQEALGGAMLGLLLGWITFRLLRSIDDYKVEVMLTLALVMGGYALAELIHVSAPICMVVAGLVTGNHGRAFGMSDLTRGRLDEFWELIDEILNAMLFVLIGLEVMIITLQTKSMLLGLCAVVAVLFGRFVSVGLPITMLRVKMTFEPGTIRLLTWGGLRGGLSIAMALSLPQGAEKEVIVQATYVVVLFSILVQGLTFSRLVRHLTKQ